MPWTNLDFTSGTGAGGDGAGPVRCFTREYASAEMRGRRRASYEDDFEMPISEGIARLRMNANHHAPKEVPIPSVPMIRGLNGCRVKLEGIKDIDFLRHILPRSCHLVILDL